MTVEKYTGETLSIASLLWRGALCRLFHLQQYIPVFVTQVVTPALRVDRPGDLIRAQGRIARDIERYIPDVRVVLVVCAPVDARRLLAPALAVFPAGPWSIRNERDALVRQWRPVAGDLEAEGVALPDVLAHAWILGEREDLQARRREQSVDGAAGRFDDLSRLSEDGRELLPRECGEELPVGGVFAPRNVLATLVSLAGDDRAAALEAGDGQPRPAAEHILHPVLDRDGFTPLHVPLPPLGDMLVAVEPREVEAPVVVRKPEEPLIVGARIGVAEERRASVGQRAVR